MQKSVSATLLSFGAVFVLGTGAAYAEKKVTICHVPPGNPGTRHTIWVGESAVSAHLVHGDEVGECRTGCPQDAALCDDENACTTDSCNASGACEHDTVNCDDGNSCTADRCSASEGCLYDPDDGLRGGQWHAGLDHQLRVASLFLSAAGLRLREGHRLSLARARARR